MDLSAAKHNTSINGGISNTGSYNYYKTAFDFIDEGDFAFYINTPLGVDFLKYLKTQNKKLWMILAQNERNLSALNTVQKQYLLKTFNSFYLNNSNYNAYVEITTDKDKERFNHILHSKYGDLFLTKLAREYPGLHYKFTSADFKIEFLRDTDCTAFLILFNQFFKNKCKNINVAADIARTSPAMAKKLAQSKQAPRPAPDGAGPRAYFAFAAQGKKKPAGQKKNAAAKSKCAKQEKKSATVGAAYMQPLQGNTPSQAAPSQAAPSPEKHRVTDEVKLKDFCKFYDEAMARPASLDEKAAQTAQKYLNIEESSELRYFMRGLKYAGIEEPSFAQEMFGAYIIEDCKSDMVWAYEKRLFKQWGYDPDNTSVLQDKKTGKILFFDKRQIINYGRTTEGMYEQILASANTAAESYNASLEFMFRQVRQGNSYIEAERKFKEKYGPNADVALTYIQHKFYTGSNGTLAGGKYTAAKDINLTGFKQTLFNLISYRINKEGLQLAEKSHYMLLATGVFLKLDFVKGPKTLDNIKRCLAGIGQFSFKKPGTQNDITTDSENPPAFAARKICDAVIDIEGEKGFAAHFADSFSAHVSHAGSTLKLFTDATAGAVKGLVIDMPKVVIDCGLNPLLAPLFFFNLTTPEGFASLKQEFFEKMKSTNTGEVAAYISFNAAMAVGMLKHGGEMAKHGIKSIVGTAHCSGLTLKLTKEKTTVIINGTEYADPETVDYVLHYATQNKWRSTKFEVTCENKPAEKSVPRRGIKPRPAKARAAKKAAVKKSSKKIKTVGARGRVPESAPKPGTMRIRKGGVGARLNDGARALGIEPAGTSRRYHHPPAKEVSPELGKRIGAANLSVEEPARERPGVSGNGKPLDKAEKARQEDLQRIFNTIIRTFEKDIRGMETLKSLAEKFDSAAVINNYIDQFIRIYDSLTVEIEKELSAENRKIFMNLKNRLVAEHYITILIKIYDLIMNRVINESQKNGIISKLKKPAVRILPELNAKYNELIAKHKNAGAQAEYAAFKEAVKNSSEEEALRKYFSFELTDGQQRRFTPLDSEHLTG